MRSLCSRCNNDSRMLNTTLPTHITHMHITETHIHTNYTKATMFDCV
jgi:hypothetical protein